LPISSREIIRRLEAAGWRLARVTGSHHHFRHPQNPGVVTVVHPQKDVKTGTLRSIERQSGVRLRKDQR
jgi:predicted RNA binding protein YcfA (HicA-like mRNA interferase family)